jgi:general secretion pathway protein G
MSESRERFVAWEQQRLQQGFKLFEFAVAVAVFAILLTVLLQRLSFYQDDAEDVAVRHVVANIRTALDIKLAEGRLPGNTVDLTILSEKNPLDLLTKKPANYLGEYSAPADKDVTPGNWYFDRQDKTLVYLLNVRSSFGSTQLKRLKFKVKLLRLPKNPAKPPGAAQPVGLAFEQVNG